MDIRFTLNDELAFATVPPTTPLARILRDHFSIGSLHQTCASGQCGQCLVLLEGAAVPSCIVPAFSVRGYAVETVEGLLSKPEFMDLEKGFLEAGLSPCPLCAGNKAILAESLIRHHPELQRQEILSALPRHWCPCSTVDTFTNAVLAAWNHRRRRARHAQTS